MTTDEELEWELIDNDTGKAFAWASGIMGAWALAYFNDKADKEKSPPVNRDIRIRHAPTGGVVPFQNTGWRTAK